MNAPSRGYRAATSLLKPSKPSRICSQCIFSASARLPWQTRRSYAVAVTTETHAASSPTPPPSSKPIIKQQPPVSQTETNTSSKKEWKKKLSANRPPLTPYRIQSGVLLSRPPLLTRDLHPFEESFFLYQKRLNERLALPFTRYFYFKKDTPADNDYKLKAKARNGVASRDIGGYAAYSEFGWNDELLTTEGDIAKKTNAVEELLKESILRINEDGSVRVLAEGEEAATLNDLRPLPRTTLADQQNNRQRLDRALDRTLYLVVRDAKEWRLPSGDLIGRESLVEAAERILVQTAGPNMNTWIAGRVPIGHHIVEPQFEETKTIAAQTPDTQGITPVAPEPPIVQQGRKTFFMKGRIMAGQAVITHPNPFGLRNFQWATREEVKKLVRPAYWHAIQGMFASR